MSHRHQQSCLRSFKLAIVLVDETGEWEVIALPYSTAGGRAVHARVQRIGEPDSWEIRNWDALSAST